MIPIVASGEHRPESCLLNLFDADFFELFQVEGAALFLFFLLLFLKDFRECFSILREEEDASSDFIRGAINQHVTIAFHAVPWNVLFHAFNATQTRSCSTWDYFVSLCWICLKELLHLHRIPLPSIRTKFLVIIEWSGLLETDNFDAIFTGCVEKLRRGWGEV